MALRIDPLHPLFGAEILDVDIDRCDDAMVATLTDALTACGVLLFRKTPCDDHKLARFAARFGPLQNLSGRPEAPLHILRVSNLAEDGTLKPGDEPSRKQHDANRLWHADGTFMQPGPSFSFLQGRIVTTESGHTEFCDTRVAWDQLPTDEQDKLGRLRADHCMLQSWSRVGVEMPNATRATMPVTNRPLVLYHEPSSRHALMIPSHVERIDGYGYEEGQALLARLTSIAAAPAKIYQHHWQVGDLLIWDNRCMLHRVTPYDGSHAPRDLRSCRIVNLEDMPGAVPASRH